MRWRPICLRCWRLWLSLLGGVFAALLVPTWRFQNCCTTKCHLDELHFLELAGKGLEVGRRRPFKALLYLPKEWAWQKKNYNIPILFKMQFHQWHILMTVPPGDFNRGHQLHFSTIDVPDGPWGGKVLVYPGYDTLPMEVEKSVPGWWVVVSNMIVFHFHDDGRRSKWVEFVQIVFCYKIVTETFKLIIPF